MRPRAALVALLALTVGLVTVMCGGPAPAHKVIFIPGFAGSELWAAESFSVDVPLRGGRTKRVSAARHEVIWPHFDSNQVESFYTILFDPEYYTVLRLKDDGTDQAPIEANQKIYTDMGGYAEAMRFFEWNGYRLGETFFPFGWDWRRSATDPKVQQPLEDLVQRIAPGNAQVDIVAHSMGALVLRQFLMKDANRAKVAHAVFVSGTNLGAPVSNDAVLIGHCLQTFGPVCVFPGEINSYILQTSQDAIDDVTGAAYYQYFADSSGAHPLPYVVIGPNGAAAPGQNGWPAMASALIARGVPSPIVSNAARFRTNDLTWLAAVLAASSPPRIAIGGGSGKCTLAQIRVASDGVTRPQADGDTYVPRQSALLGEDLDLSYMSGGPSLSSRIVTYLRSLEHSEMAGTAGLPVVLSFLRDQPLPSPGQGTVVQHQCGDL